jgi:hypothetical protein
VVPTNQASLFFEESYPGLTPVEGTFLQAAKRQRGQRAAKPSNTSAFPYSLTYDSVQLIIEQLIGKYKKVRRGATLEEAEIDPSWLNTYATISRHCRDDMDLGISR